MFIAMKRVAVNIFFVTVMEQSRCDYQDRIQYTYLKKYDDVRNFLRYIEVGGDVRFVVKNREITIYEKGALGPGTPCFACE